MKLKNILAVAFLSLGSTAFAQSPAAVEGQSLDYYPQPYNFIQLQGGIGNVFTNGTDFLKPIYPTFSVAVGRMFTSAVGARLHVNGIEAKCGFRDYDDKYKFNYISTNVDVMLNLVNIITKKSLNPVDVYLIGGVGLNTAWSNEDFQKLQAAHPFSPNLEWGKGTTRKTLFAHNIRAGVLVDYNVCKNFSVGVEADINNTSDRFNSKYNDADDWMLTTQLSLTYKFGHKPYVNTVVEAPVTTQADYDAAAAAAAEAAAKAAAAKAAAAKAAAAKAAAAKAAEVVPLKETFFYKIRVSDVNNEGTFQKIVDWCNKYPNKGITVDGYADKGTGNAKINKKYAEARATKVADKLKSMGVAADRIQVASYGDTVQPFEANDDNRCVIVIGK